MAGTDDDWRDGADRTEWSSDWTGDDRNPRTGAFAWSEQGADSSGWYADDWSTPTEQAPRRKRWPLILAGVMGVLILAMGGLVAWLLVGGREGATVVEAGTDSAPWSTQATSSTSRTSATSAAPVVPARGGSSGASTCTKEDLARDSGWGEISYLDCFGDWAVVRPRAGTGDGGVFRLVNGTWRPTRYGPSSCMPPDSGAEVPAALRRKHLIECGSGTSRSRPSTSSRPSRPSTSSRTSEAPAPPPPPAPEPPAPEPPAPEPTPQSTEPSETQQAPPQESADTSGEGYTGEEYGAEGARSAAEQE